jgi:hypothetical protein
MAGMLIDSLLRCTCSVMTRVRQSVVGVVISCHFFLHESADAEKHATIGQIKGQCTCMHFKRALDIYK